MVINIRKKREVRQQEFLVWGSTGSSLNLTNLTMWLIQSREKTLGSLIKKGVIWTGKPAGTSRSESQRPNT